MATKTKATKTKAPYVKVKFTFDGTIPVEHYDKPGMNLNLLVLDAIKKKSDDCLASCDIPNMLWTSSDCEGQDEEYPFKVRLNRRPVEKKGKNDEKKDEKKKANKDKKFQFPLPFQKDKKDKTAVNNPIKIVADCQNILNEVVEKYGEDPSLEKKVDALWEECCSTKRKK